MNIVKKVSEAVLVVGMAFLILWVFASVVDVNMHNSPLAEDRGQIAEWNILEVLQ